MLFEACGYEKVGFRVSGLPILSYKEVGLRYQVCIVKAMSMAIMINSGGYKKTNSES